MNVGSCFSGVGGIDLGLERAGHNIVFQCERDEWCRRVLAKHWPGVPCFEDICAVDAASWAARRSAGRRAVGGDGHGTAGDGSLGGAASLDLLCGGFPCQDVSVAGRRAGFAGERSSLFFEFARVADDLVRDGGWVLIENVPGLLSSHGGRDFAVLLATLADIGFHDLAWRVLDSRYFGVPQRRRRVFILGRRATGRGACEVLLEPESGGGDFAPRTQAGARVAATASRGSASPGVAGVAPSIVKRYGKGTDSDATDCLIAHTLRAGGFDASEDGTGRGTPLTITGPLGGGNDGAGRRSEDDPNLVYGAPADSDGDGAAPGLPGRLDGAAVIDPKPDGPRYAAMGNAVTVPVAEWIGWRLAEFADG